jgi:hypothetical protein
MSRSVRGSPAAGVADRMVVAFACALALSTVTPAVAGPSAEVAVGLSNAIVIAPSDDRFHPGFAPLVAALGWRLGSRAAVGLRSATYLVPATVAGQREPFLATFAGPSVWIWPGGDLVLGAAAGPALVWPAPIGASPYLHTNRGVALSLRAGWSVGRAAAGDVLVGAELLPTFFDGGDLLIGTLLTAGLLW